MANNFKMHELDVMAGACVDAIESMEQDPHWRSAYTHLVDPARVLQLIAIARLQVPEREPERISEEQRRALGKLVRDLTGYLKLVTGDKTDPVRDDLISDARNLLEQAGI